MIGDNVLSPQITLNMDGNVVLWNSDAILLTGYEAADILGKHFRILHSVENLRRNDFEEVLKLAMLDGNVAYEDWHVKQDGSHFWACIKIVTICDEVGGSTTYSVEMYPASQTNQVTEKLRARNAELEKQLRQSQKMEAIGRLAGGVAHDFNNILAIISLCSEMIASELPTDHPLQDINKEIMKAQKRGAGLTQQLLLYSRKQAVIHRQFDLNDVISGLEKMLKPVLGEEIELIIKVSEAPALVKGDFGQMEQILMNLVVNARDSIERNGTITIQTECLEFKVRLCVTDTGIGMSDEIKSKIFEPFFTTKEVGKGTGLGLAAVHGVLSQMDGTVTVDSELGEGSNFQLYFPKQSIPIEKNVAIGVSKGQIKKERLILLVEDEEVLRNLVEKKLIRNGHKVLNASNGNEALGIYEKTCEKIDLIITDVVMPVMSGTELIERVRLIQPDAQVIFMSGYTDDTLRKYGVSGHEDFFIEKPFAAQTLLAKIDKILAKEG
jgi:two-component system, cell cycle sensor histidine kinase and response regulator CckA